MFRGVGADERRYILPSPTGKEMDIAKVTWLDHHTKHLYMDEAGCNSIGEMKQKGINTFKGKCYETVVAIYELCDGDGLSLYRTMDEEGVWHWFMVIDELYDKRIKEGYDGDFLIDPTAYQYRIEDKQAPTHKIRFGKRGEELNNAEKMRPLHFPSMKDKVEAFKTRLTDYMEAREHKRNTKRVTIMDFVEEDKKEEPPAIKKQATLEDFFE